MLLYCWRPYHCPSSSCVFTGAARYVLVSCRSYLKDTKVDRSPRQRQDEAERPDGLAPANGTQVFTAGLPTPSSNHSFVVVKLGLLFRFKLGRWLASVLIRLCNLWQLTDICIRRTELNKAILQYRCYIKLSFHWVDSPNSSALGL